MDVYFFHNYFRIESSLGDTSAASMTVEQPDPQLCEEIRQVWVVVVVQNECDPFYDAM